MLELKDFNVLPEFTRLLDQIIAGPPGMVLVAGLDPQTSGDDPRGFLPSGRATILRILMRQLTDRHKPRNVAVVAPYKEAIRLPRRLERRVSFFLPRGDQLNAQLVDEAARSGARLLVLDELQDAETAWAALRAARQGVRVLTQIDTILCGSGVMRQLLEMGLQPAELDGLHWILTVQRLPTLCPHCKQPAADVAEQVALLQERYPQIEIPADATFYEAHGCIHCEGSGRLGQVTAFDLFDAREGMGDNLPRLSLFPLGSYLFGLAAGGQLSLDDVLNLESEQLRRVYHMLAGSEQTLAEVNRSLHQKVAQLESAYHVLQRRTEALISLQEMSQALITVGDLQTLAHRICRHACELAQADRAILYYLHEDASGTATEYEVLASHGWDPARLPATVPLSDLPLPNPGAPTEPQPYERWPPGVERRASDVEGFYLYAGLKVPLVAQNRPVGVLLVHLTQRRRFEPGDVALLSSCANQAALALQREGLIEELRQKVAALEAAQVQIAQKERLERELELARQVQQSALPRSVPQITGYQFAMCNEPARWVGGDFYDVVQLDDDAFAVVIADVSDKGMPAALYMALSRSLLLREARLARTPYDVICSVNDLLLELGQPDMFVTVFYALIERSTRRMTYLRAGHDRPLLFRGDTVHELGGQGMVLGLLPAGDIELVEEELLLEPGDRLVLYTDGLTDAVAPDGELYDRPRLIQLLQQHAALPPDALCRTAFSELTAYRGNRAQEDDMTMVVVDVEE